jgi:predicted esterase
MGKPVFAVWKEYSSGSHRHPGGAAAEAVGFQKSVVDLNAHFSLSWENNLLDAANLVGQVAQLEGGADQGSSALRDQLWSIYQDCGVQTRYVLVGYSQGAWAIDKFLRGQPENPVLPVLLEQTAGVFLMGDPAWPVDSQWPGRQGLATWAHHGVSDPYVHTAVANRFQSMCVSYEGNVYDSICLFKPEAWDKFLPGIDAHKSYADNGMATNGGRWLASIAS